jgi:hypothetical protein
MLSDRNRPPGIVDVIPSAVITRCLKFLVGGAIVYFALQLFGFQRLFKDDAEGLGALLQIIGTLYSVLYAFATYVIWGQFTAVENEILKESGALKDLMLFSNRLKANTREPMVRTVKTYARAVVEGEWRALSNAEGTEKTDRLFAEVIAAVADAKPEDDTERMVYERLLDIANQASTPSGRAAGFECKTHAPHAAGVCDAHSVHDPFPAIPFSFPERSARRGRHCRYHVAPVLGPRCADRPRQSLRGDVERRGGTLRGTAVEIPLACRSLRLFTDQKSDNFMHLEYAAC